MLTDITHAPVLVADQDAARTFYTETLGFEVRDDVPMESGRWLTVGLPDREFLQLVLQQGDGGGEGTFVLASDDVHADYDGLTEAGVTFHGEPTEMPWGTECVFEDPDGNTFDLLEPTEMDEAAMADLLAADQD
ncbi:VOC family protein [Halorarius litoreus]|uniref:VOC family protein n=1 Tax=Halorarius litoreus TaxID=2962676 RepID=UPI0020CEDCE1|nr:VOC family protein [Halorarius litoreus]